VKAERLTSVRISKEIEEFCKEHNIKFVDLLRRGFSVYKMELEGGLLKPSDLNNLSVRARNYFINFHSKLMRIKELLDGLVSEVEGFNEELRVVVGDGDSKDKSEDGGGV